jgi:hypothetical protein
LDANSVKSITVIKEAGVDLDEPREPYSRYRYSNVVWRSQGRWGSYLRADGEYAYKVVRQDDSEYIFNFTYASSEVQGVEKVTTPGKLEGATDYAGYNEWSAAITDNGIDFGQITKDQAIAMGLPDVDYYGIAMNLVVDGKTIDLNSENLTKVERVFEGGEPVEALVTADGTVQFVHNGWGEAGKYTMYYYLKDGRVVEAKINVVNFEFKSEEPVVVTGELVAATDYTSYENWEDAITEDGIDFSKITQAQAIKMGIADPDYYGIAMYLKVGDDTIELNSDNLKSVVRIDPEGNEVEPQVTADNIYQFVHDGWGGPGEYTMLYTLKDGTIIEAKINVVSFEFKPVVLDGELVAAEDYTSYENWKDAITEDGIDFSKITQAQAIKMGIADPDYYGIAMYLKVGDDTIELNSDNLKSVVRIDPEGNEVEPQVTADNIYQFVHDGWGGPGEYTMLYTLKDGTIIEAKINVVSFEFKDEKPHIPMEVTAEVEPFTVGVQQEFIVKTVANDDAGRMVRAYFDIPAGVAVEYQEQNPDHPDYGKWFPLDDVFGPATGFPVADVDDSKFRATFDTAGDYSITIEFKEVGTGEVLATYVMEVTVNEKPHVPMEVSAEVEPFTVGVQQEFIVKTVANDDAGRMVRAYFDIPAGVAVEYQEQNPDHPDYGEWFPLEGVFGPSTGFPVMDVDDSKFRATFDTAGDYSITIEFKEVGTGEVLATYVMEVTVNEKPHVAMEVSAEVEPFTVGVQQEFIVKTVANDDAGRMVRAYFDIPAGVAVEYQEQNPDHPDYGKWFPLEGVFGPSTGFPVMNVDDSKFRATFDTAGDYSITIEFKEVGTGEVLATYVMEVTVNEKPHIPMEVTAEVGPFTVGVQQEFIVKTVANDDAGRMVRAYFELPEKATVEYYEVKDGNWYPLGNEYGPAEGFPVADATSKFRAVFSEAGTYTVTVEFKEVGTGDVLATHVMKVSHDHTVEVREFDKPWEIKASELTAEHAHPVPDLPAGRKLQL